MLQGFHLVPFTGLSCLRDTGLEAMNIPFSLSPVDLVPCSCIVGGRTSRGIRRSSFGRFRRHLLYLLSRLLKRSRVERPEGSLPVFTWDDVRLLGNPYPPYY